jgi:hypothetical protein
MSPHVPITLHEHVENPSNDRAPFTTWGFVPRLFGWRVEETLSVPLGVFRCMIAVSWNAVIMAVAEFVLEMLMLANAIDKVEFRTGFTFLTLLSALIGMHTLTDIIADQLDTTVQAMRISLLVEFGLIVSDIEYVLSGGSQQSLRFWYRVGFVVLTLVNTALLVYVSIRLKLMGKLFMTHLCTTCTPRKNSDNNTSERGRDDAEVANPNDCPAPV